MKSLVNFHKVIFIFILSVTILFTSSNYAKNVGVIGEIYLIDEEDFLEFIEARALLAEKNGLLLNLKQNIQHRAEMYRDRPKPIESISHTVNAKSWLFDPSIVLDHDLITSEGRILGQKGQHVNPLNYISLKRTLIFYDADDKKAVEWVLKLDNQLKGNDKLILVNGSLLQEEKRFSKPVYFDQSGRLISHFGISHVPAVIRQEGNALRISEVKP